MKLGFRARTTIASLLLLASAAVFHGCNPYAFEMGGDHPIACYVLTSLGGVDEGRSITTIRDTGMIQMSLYGVTQYEARLNMKLLHGSGFRLLLRPRVKEWEIPDSGMVLTVTQFGTTLDSAARTFVDRPDVKLQPNALTPVFLLSENHLMQVVVGCDTIYRGTSDKIETDDLVLQALQASEVQLVNPQWNNVPK